MRFAIISDIHSNIEALQAVFADIEARRIDTVYCLGDVVGYGPDPEACVDLVMERCEFTLRGNHDEALFTGADRFNPYARGAIQWTKDRLRPRFLRRRQNQDRWTWLKDMPEEKRVEHHYFVHGSPRDHMNEYIYREDVFFNVDPKLRVIFDVVDKTLFCGHTHLPVVISNELKTFVPSDEDSEYRLRGAKYIINVGSVGQPRDRDPRACYVEVEDDVVRYHRVEYDIQRVVEKIANIDALDPVLGTRLVDGR